MLRVYYMLKDITLEINNNYEKKSLRQADQNWCKNQVNYKSERSEYE